MPRDVLEAVQCVSDNESNFLQLFAGNPIESLKEKAARGEKTTGLSRDSLSRGQRRVQGTLNLAFLAHMLTELGKWGQNWANQFTNGFPIAGAAG